MAPKCEYEGLNLGPIRYEFEDSPLDLFEEKNFDGSLNKQKKWFLGSLQWRNNIFFLGGGITPDRTTSKRKSSLFSQICFV